MPTPKIIERTIIPWQALLIFSVIIFLIAGLQSCVAKEIEDNRIQELDSTITARSVACNVESFDEQGKMLLSCGKHGRKELSDTSLALAYATKHRPFVCTLYRGNPPDCAIKKAK